MWIMFDPLSPLCFMVLNDNIFNAVHSSHISDRETEKSLTVIILVESMSFKINGKSILLTARTEEPLSCSFAFHHARHSTRVLGDSPLKGFSKYKYAAESEVNQINIDALVKSTYLQAVELGWCHHPHHLVELTIAHIPTSTVQT